MKILAVFVLAFVYLATSDKLSNRDVLENINNSLEEMTERKEASAEETEEELEILGNKSQTNDESMEKEGLQVADVLRATCCKPGMTYINLTNNAPSHGINTAPGVTIITSPTNQGTSTDCSKMALLKVNFERYTAQPHDNCVRNPLCGRQMLRIDLKLSDGPRSGFGFDVGDSDTNNGYAGDWSTQENDCEAEGTFPNVQVWASDKCNAKSLKIFSNAISTAVKDVTIYVSNGYIRIVNDQGLDDYLCDKCLYAFSGQSDNQGSVNEDIYIGLNRVVDGTYRNGYGVCSATLHWSCPFG